MLIDYVVVCSYHLVYFLKAENIVPCFKKIVGKLNEVEKLGVLLDCLLPRSNLIKSATKL